MKNHLIIAAVSIVAITTYWALQRGTAGSLSPPDQQILTADDAPNALPAKIVAGEVHYSRIPV
jgi:hypothetical protein